MIFVPKPDRKKFLRRCTTARGLADQILGPNSRGGGKQFKLAGTVLDRRPEAVWLPISMAFVASLVLGNFSGDAFFVKKSRFRAILASVDSHHAPTFC